MRDDNQRENDRKVYF